MIKSSKSKDKIVSVHIGVFRRGVYTLGHVWVVVRISNLERSRSKTVKALVDTGATLSVIPRSLARELGIDVVRKDKVRTGAGVIEVDRGVAVIELMGKETVSEVWISDVIDKVLIGAVTLEMLGLEVDPLTGKLRESPLLLY